MLNVLIILFGKLLIKFSQIFNLGSGSTWPGHIALKFHPNFSKQVISKSKIKVIVIAGTNGKTTTARLITSIIREANHTYLQNKAGANLLNGLASTLIKGANINGKLGQDFLIFECDENALPEILTQANPDYLVCLNLFRDQLDRYGEIDSIAKKWHTAIEKLTHKTTLILNADDPQIAYLGHHSKSKVEYFGLDQKSVKELMHGADSTYCPKCSNKLIYANVFFSHLGIWSCPNCKLRRPNPDLTTLKAYPLPGTYNKYNILAAVIVAKNENVKLSDIEKSIANFKPAFGRQEKLTYKEKNIQIFLSKNPISFNESLSTIQEMGGKNILIILNDRIPDGLDVSWIWDINFEEILEKDMNIGIAGDRAYDIALRLKYAQQFTHIEPNSEIMLNKLIEHLEKNETLFILANYSAMLDIRKIITGKKIL